MPTIDGRTIPKATENSLLIKGFNKPSSLYTAAIGSRKSLIMNKKVITLLVTTYSNICFKPLELLETLDKSLVPKCDNLMNKDNQQPRLFL